MPAMPLDVAPAGAAPAGAAPPDAGAQAAPTQPGTQITHALVTVSRGPEGANLSVQLNPAELGRVSISLAQTGTSGATHIVIAAERPETLALLQQDKPALQHALDQAGIAPQGRELSFALAPTDPPPTPAHVGGGFADGSGGGAPGRFSGGGAGGSGSEGLGGGPGGGGQARQDQHGARQDTTTRWLRAGIDITA